MRGEYAPQIAGLMTWDAVGRALERGAAAILPIGAGAKQHGLHLPMNTDQIQAEWLAARVAERIEAVIWPTVTYGHYPAFVAYTGSTSIVASTFQALIQDIVGGLLGYGARTVLVINTGISTIAPVDRAISALGNDRVRHLKVYDGPRLRAAVERLTGQTTVGHADEIETSCMLALAPKSVTIARADAAWADMAAVEPGPLTPDDRGSPNYSRSGSLGDPRRASREKGELLLVAMVSDLLESAQAAVATATGPVATPAAGHESPP